MILEVKDKKGRNAKFCNVTCVGVINGHETELYYQQRIKRKDKTYPSEHFIWFAFISEWFVR